MTLQFNFLLVLTMIVIHKYCDQIYFWTSKSMLSFMRIIQVKKNFVIYINVLKNQGKNCADMAPQTYILQLANKYCRKQ